MDVQPEIAVLYHGDADGFGAAYACWYMLSHQVSTPEKIIYIPVQYHRPVPELPESIEVLFIVDFSYDRETLLRLAGRFGEEFLTVIDHHQTARKELDGLSFVVFDEAKSGAVLTWEYLAGEYPLCQYPETPTILNYVQDRDLWKFELPRSKEVNAYIAALPREFEVWHLFTLETAIIAGDAILSFQKNQIDSRLRNVRVMDNFMGTGYAVPVVNATENMSELGNEMCTAYPHAPFSVSYCDRGDGVRSYSLRSVGEFDVSAVARQFGGGGHRNAAGFACQLPEA